MANIGLDSLMCHTCGTQFDNPADQPLDGCQICDRWTSLRKERDLKGAEAHENHIVPLTAHRNSDSQLTEPISASSGAESSMEVATDAYTMYTSPKLGIGERVILIPTPNGTIIWDLLAYLDDATIKALKAPPFNGVKAIVISHPHYYSNHLDWAEAFDCPVYVAAEDEEWLNRKDVHGRRRFITGTTQEIVPGVTAIKVGGHFPGSLVLHWNNKLFVADSMVTAPSALYHIKRPAGTISYTFMWSIPNMIPLSPSELLKMWQVIEPFQFDQTHGAFMGQGVYDIHVKDRILESMKIQTKNSTGHDNHEIMKYPSLRLEAK